MKIKIEFDCDNAAFEDDMTGEISCILREIADDIDRSELHDLHGVYSRVSDVNGNQIGTVQFFA